MIFGGKVIGVVFMKKRIYFLTLACIGLIIVWIFYGLWSSTYNLECTYYYPKNEKIMDEVKIVQLSDLHNSKFGDNNSKLVDIVRELYPDAIAITGDILNSNEEDLSTALDLIEELSLIAPVYFSYGNHELEYEEVYGADLGSEFSDAGAIVLDEQYVDIEINGQNIRIGGIYGYCLPERYHSNEDEVKFLREFEATDSYKILLSHLPYAWVNYGFTADYDIDLIFAGHVHGGQVIFPVIGGLYDQEFGFFPGKMKGIYYENNTTTVLSSGLGSNKEKLPRFNNIPEIVVTTINAE